MSRALDTLQVFRDIIQLNPIKSVLPIATSAVREANNRDEFLNNTSKETGFNFKVLTEREEALYSYVGAIKSLHVPDVLFFDIGGGSLEIVYAERFKIKKVISLPLGALRLTRQFGGKKGKFTDKNFKDLNRYVWDLLPNKKDLGLSTDVKLVGVGGALRALARYEQRISRYPLDKIHNYKINRISLDSIVDELSKMKSDDISKISVIGSSRAETIVAGSCVIDTLMEKYTFSDLYVSDHGLREGALSIFLEDPKAYHDGYLRSEQIGKIIGLDEQNKTSQEKDGFLNALLSIKMISKRERTILDYTEKIISENSSFSNPQSVFYSVMDEDMPLNHNDQLVLGLSLVHARHTKTSEWLFARYKTILSQQDRSSMKKISALITLKKVLERTKSKIEVKQYGSKIMEITITQSRSIQKFLLKDVLRKFEAAFDVKVILSMRSYHDSSQTSILEL
jgi:exopolyphosphatase/guanosine-5'-triphosphate,3'-diphosphate pyrophosphatase